MKRNPIKNASLKAQIVLVAIIPTIITTLCLIIVGSYELQHIEQRNITTVREALLEAKWQVLKHSLASAVAAIDSLYHSASAADQDAQQAARAVVGRLNQQGDIYFFIYPYQPVYLASSSSQLETNRFLHRKFTHDEWSTHVMPEGVKPGGGYDLSSKSILGPKAPERRLSYSVDLDKWQWMLGATLPLDAVDAEIQRLQQQIASDAWRILGIALTSATAALVVIIIAALRLGATWPNTSSSISVEANSSKDSTAVLAAVKQTNDPVTEFVTNDPEQKMQEGMRAMVRISQMTQQHTDLRHNTAAANFALEDQALTLRRMMDVLAFKQA